MVRCGRVGGGSTGVMLVVIKGFEELVVVGCSGVVSEGLVRLVGSSDQWCNGGVGVM